MRFLGCINLTSFLNKNAVEKRLNNDLIHKYKKVLSPYNEKELYKFYSLLIVVRLYIFLDSDRLSSFAPPSNNEFSN